MQALHGVTLKDVCDSRIFPSHHYNPDVKPGWVIKTYAIYFATDFEEVISSFTFKPLLLKVPARYSCRRKRRPKALFWCSFCSLMQIINL